MPDLKVRPLAKTNRLVLSAALGAIPLLSSGAATAQTYEPLSGKSPLVLLDAPKDGVAYYQTMERARALHKAQKWAEAEPVLEQLTRDYPRDPETWTMLGRVKARLKKWPEARAAWEKAGPLIGWDVEFPNGYRIAIDYVAEGNKRAALDTLRRMIFEQHGFYRADLFEWEEFASLKNDAEFLETIGRVDITGWTRDRGWLSDIDYLYDEVKRVNPDYRDKPFPVELDRRYQELKRDVPKLADEEIFFGMRRMLAPLHQGHVDFWPAPNSRFLPVRFYAFPEGVFVIDAGAEHKGLVGARVVAIGDLPIEEAWRRLSDSKSVDGDMEYVWSVSSLAEAGILKGMGAVKSQDSVILTVDRDRHSQQVPIATSATPPSDEQSERIDRLLAPKGVTAPLFLSNLKQKFWHRSLAEQQALYVQINNLSDMPDESLESYGRRLWTVLNEIDPKNLILDLRHNNGGTTQYYPELLRTIVAFSRVPSHQVYALIGRRTYSADGNFVTDLERLADPIFVGEASSECCNLHGDPTSITLPYSKVQLEATALRWQLSSPSDRRRELSPEVPVQLTAKAYFAGQDPLMEAVFRLIQIRRAPAATAAVERSRR
jgi:tetratricopeptide (TPR) repeat protein